jgi:hypothetical protein
VICNFIRLAPWIAYLVGPVEPVELCGIRRAQVELLGGTGGTGVGLAFRSRVSPVPPVPPTGTTKSRQEGLKYHRFHRLHLPHDRPRASLESIS